MRLGLVAVLLVAAGAVFVFASKADASGDDGSGTGGDSGDDGGNGGDDSAGPSPEMEARIHALAKQGAAEGYYRPDDPGLLVGWVANQLGYSQVPRELYDFLAPAVQRWVQKEGL